MLTGLRAFAVTSGVAAFGACGLSLALLGLGLPYVLCAAIAGACAGLLLYALGRWRSAPPTPVYVPLDPVVDPAADRLEALEREMSGLRHELRGALSPALMVSDRLLRSEDPLIRRAGDAVVRSVDRAMALIGQDTPSSSANLLDRSAVTPRAD